MEKIYMEDNQKKNHSSRQLKYTVVLSFAVAIFALFSLASFTLAAYGNHGGVSYALPLSDDDFVLEQPKDSSDNIFMVRSLNSSGVTTSWHVPIYLANGDSDYPVFCVQHAVSPDIDGDYSKDEVINDYGLLYLLRHSFVNDDPVTTATGENAKYVETWITQTAIWVYLAEDDESSPNYLSTAQLDAIKATRSLALTNGNDYDDVINFGIGTDFYTEYVVPLVEAARNASSERQLSVQFSDSDPASIAEDKSFYQSPKVTVTGNPAEDLTSYDVTVSGVNGAYLVDESGNNLNATNIPAGTVFYVRVPSDKVGTETIDVTVNVKGHFNTLTGSYFTATATTGGPYQRVATVTGANVDVLGGDTFQIIPTPPTGMNAVQTIYFIGLIVLLCGVGIVYANAKPVESKQ